MDHPYHAMKKFGIIKQLKKENVCRNFDDALKIAKRKLQELPT
jgi:hypothetical protein